MTLKSLAPVSTPLSPAGVRLSARVYRAQPNGLVGNYSRFLESRAPGRKLSRACAAPTEAKDPPETAVKLKWHEKNMKPNMVDIHGTEDFLEEMASAGDRLVIVDFYATWCHACRGLYPRLSKLMEEHPDVKLLKVEFESNRSLCKSLGVKVLPFFHFYRGNEGRLDAFSASLKKIGRLKDAIEMHNTPRCALGDAVVYKDIKDVANAVHSD